MVGKGNLAVFESWSISETGDAMPSCPPKSVYMHVTSMHACMNFLSRFY